MNVGRSGLSDLKEPKLRAGDYAPQFSLKHMDKDLRLALETAADSICPRRKHLSRSTKGDGCGYGRRRFHGMIRLLDNSKD